MDYFRTFPHDEVVKDDLKTDFMVSKWIWTNNK